MVDDCLGVGEAVCLLLSDFLSSIPGSECVICPLVLGWRM